MDDETHATILCVDDTPDVLEVLSLFLQSEGYRVVAANNAQEAILRIREHLPDLVVTDQAMPGMSGIELCRMLRATPETRGIPIILHTGAGIPEDAPRDYDSAFRKPADLDVMAGRIRVMLRS